MRIMGNLTRPHYGLLLHFYHGDASRVHLRRKRQGGEWEYRYIPCNLLNVAD
jgi:hypothetical protein